jgi:hypothetical protein
MNEREEMDAEEAAQNEKVNQVREEMQRIAAGARSMFIVAVTPNGEMSSLCFFAGYADMRAMQIEGSDRIREIIAVNSKRGPTQLI